ncbi:hypothetical protein JCM21900_006417 [Sporobolomyces salmonicolor]
MSSYGTRRNSAASQPVPIGGYQLSTSASQSSFGTPLSSSVGKQKRSSTISMTRRLSSSTQSSRPGLALSPHSVPVSTFAGRGRSTSISHPEDDEEDAPQQSGKSRKDKGQTFECEKCSKVYRHSTCLTKHRWHWKEASKLLLSKHQQVQLLEGAAILAAASAGTSLPDEKSYWPAAVSPPSSGLLGSSEHGINIHSLTASVTRPFGSPRFAPSSLLSDVGDFDTSRSEVSIDEDSDDDLEEGSSPAAEGLGQMNEADEDEQIMEDGMFDLDLGGSNDLSPALPSSIPAHSSATSLGRAHLSHPATRQISPSDSSEYASGSSRSSSAARPPIRSSDSGFGSLSRSGTIKVPTVQATQAVVHGATTAPAKPIMGFFVPGR